MDAELLEGLVNQVAALGEEAGLALGEVGEVGAAGGRLAEGQALKDGRSRGRVEVGAQTSALNLF